MEFTEKERRFLEMLFGIAKQIVEYSENFFDVDFDSTDLFYLEKKLGLIKY